MSRNNRQRFAGCLALLFAAFSGERPSPAADVPFVFRVVANDAGLREPLKGAMAHAAAWGDVNGDGWLDLFVGTFADRPAANYIAGGASGPVPNRLLINRNGRFELSDQPGIAWLGRASGSVLADLDNDGLPELYVANNGRLGNRNLLYHNRGNGLFENVTERAGAPMHLPETARSVSVLDFDGDGLLDLLVLATVRKGETLLFRNRGGMKFERSDAIPGDARGLGLAVGDLTGNGWPDVMIGGPNRLFVNQGNGTYREATELGLAHEFTREDDSPSCGVAFGDFDRDGNMDMLIGSHHKAPWRKPNAIRLFRNLGSTPRRVRFDEVTEKVGIVKYPMKVPHVEMRDFDNDGWLDLYTAIVIHRDGKVYPAIYKNLGATPGGLPRFQETAFVHRADFPGPEDDAPGKRSKDFYDRLVANRKLMYFAPGPSGDFDNDGRLDLFLPSWFPKYRSLLLKNETKSGHYLDVEVVGSKGVNRTGIGAVVRAYRSGQGGRLHALLASEEVATGYGFCSGQSAIAHLGLGEVTVCDVVVTLPHGKGEIIKRNVKANQRLKIAQ
ncbi:MAG: VCBS repeat-containing protein [Planctomycetota bacterium]|nr:VCBS repeat-containing protein [Planctomycetota bacterium]